MRKPERAEKILKCVRKRQDRPYHEIVYDQLMDSDNPVKEATKLLKELRDLEEVTYQIRERLEPSDAKKERLLDLIGRTDTEGINTDILFQELIKSRGKRNPGKNYNSTVPEWLKRNRVAILEGWTDRTMDRVRFYLQMEFGIQLSRGTIKDHLLDPPKKLSNSSKRQRDHE